MIRCPLIPVGTHVAWEDMSGSTKSGIVIHASARHVIVASFNAPANEDDHGRPNYPDDWGACVLKGRFVLRHDGTYQSEGIASSATRGVLRKADGGSALDASPRACVPAGGAQ